MSSEIEARLEGLIQKDEDLLTEEERPRLLEHFSKAEQAAVLVWCENKIIEEVIAVMQQYPALSFHEIKNHYPFPNSDQVRAAKAKLFPGEDFTPKKHH